MSSITASAPAPAAPPVRAPGVQLLGPLSGSGYRRPPSLVRRADGQTVQLTPLLYATLEAADGSRTSEEIARHVAAGEGVDLTAADVEALLDKLRPLGVLATEDGEAPDAERSNPLLALRFRYVVTDPDRTSRITRPFAALFQPVAVALVVVAFTAICGWLLGAHGLAGPTRDVFADPVLLLTVFGLTIASAGFHELGHAAACHYGGARPGAMGVGLYIVFPAFYTDVTASYALDRRGRLRVDLGGLYFNAVFGVGAFALWLVTQWEALLVLVPLQLVQMVRQLLPLIRLDGYHILADLTGVPDLFAHIKPTLLGLLPWRRQDRQVRARSLRPWARTVVTTWVVLVVPLLALMLLTMVLVFPRLAATAWTGASQQWTEVAAYWSDGDVPHLALALLGLVSYTLPFLGTAYLLTRVVRRSGAKLWQATEGSPPKRSALYLATAGLAVLLVLAWWPGPRYEPISENERWAFSDLLEAVHVSDVVEPDGAAAADSENAAATPGAAIGTDVPTVVVTIDPADIGLDPAALEEFDFQLPDAPDEEGGDNQALALNRVDGSIVRVGEASLVWVFEGDVAMRNEAWALSNCRGCASEALAYQVILVVGDAEVVAPENIAVAVNGNCIDCVSNAIARQLVLTLGVEPDDAVRAAVEEVWQRIEATVADLGTVGLEATMAALEALEAELVTAVEPLLAEVPVPPSSATASTAPPSPTTSPTPTTSPSTDSSQPSGSGDPGGSTGTDDPPEPTTTSTTDPQPTTTTTDETAADSQ